MKIGIWYAIPPAPRRSSIHASQTDRAARRAVAFNLSVPFAFRDERRDTEPRRERRRRGAVAWSVCENVGDLYRSCSRRRV